MTELLVLSVDWGKQISPGFYAQSVGFLSWSRMFTKEYADAEKSARAALRNEPDMLAAKLNLAHALLMQGDVEKAESTYEDLHGATLGDRPIREFVAEDFKALRSVGVSHPKMPEILSGF